MPQRIITAREQYELAAPWRVATTQHLGGEVYSATNGSQVVGQLFVTTTTSGRYIADMWTDPAHRGQGVATNLWRSAGCPPTTPGYQTPDGIRWAARVGAPELHITAADLDDLRRAGIPLRQRTAAWSDQGYPLQGQETPELIHMHQNLSDAHRNKEQLPEGWEPWDHRANQYAAELLDRHEAGDSEASAWADRKGYAKPDYMEDWQWDQSRKHYPEDHPVDPRTRTAAASASTYNPEHPLGQIAEAHPNVDLHAFQGPSGIALKMIRVAPEHQGQGYAGAAMRDLTSYADSAGLPMTLTPERPEGAKGMSNTGLSRWYQSHGFAPNKGRKRDFSVSDSMIRRPRTARVQTAMSDVYDEYAGHHQAPGPGTGFPIHDMTGEDYGGGLSGVPEDWYTHPHYYSSGEVSPRETKNVQRLYNQVRGNPEHPVTVYRALPHGNDSINTGDWVTPSLAYARQHAMHPDDPSQDLPVIKTTTPAKNLWQNGDSYFEFGYHGPGARAVTAAYDPSSTTDFVLDPLASGAHGKHEDLRLRDMGPVDRSYHAAPGYNPHDADEIDFLRDDQGTPLGNTWPYAPPADFHLHTSGARGETPVQKIYRGLEIEPGADLEDSLYGHSEGGLGPHWTTDRGQAHNFAGPFGVVVEADHPGQEGVDDSNLWGDSAEYGYEKEVPVSVGHPLNVTSIQHQGRELLKSPRQMYAGARGETPPLQFEPFDTMWSNGIMARHAHDSRPVGHLHWHPDGEIDSITVHPDFQRHGIGSAMLKHAVDNPGTYESTWPIHASNHMTAAGRAFAKSFGHDPQDAEVTKADDDTDDWGWTAVKRYVPAHVPYTGQNEEEMAPHLTPGFHGEQGQPVVARRRIATEGAWPKKWRGRSRPDIPWDKTWSPNHPDHQGQPWV